MGSTPTGSPRLTLVGSAIPGALDRQARVPGFDQQRLSASRVVCIGAGGLIGHVAPALVRKGVGSLLILDDDEVEESNLNRQRFYADDVGENKALALAKNLLRECTHSTQLEAVPLRLEEAVAAGIDIAGDVVVCGVDNNPGRFYASRHFRQTGVPVIHCAVSAEADHGYVFVEETNGPCLGCLFPDSVNDHRYPCPATPAVSDVLQAVGAITVYAADSCLMGRPRSWNYRRLNLPDGTCDASGRVQRRPSCGVCDPSGASPR